jgi:signal transduction histidine kinase/DNA-binding response OmpR family regulator
VFSTIRRSNRRQALVTDRRETALVVDDSEMVRFATAETLRDAGFHVLEAATGEDGLRLAADSDVVVLDVRLPDVDGFEVCRQLKTNPATASIPVLHVSGIHCDVEDRVRGLETGADAYLSRPVEAAELVATVRALLRLARTQVRLEESEARRRAAEALAEVSRALARLRNPAEVAQCVADRVRGLLGARAATFYRLEADGTAIVHAFSEGPGPASPAEETRGTGTGAVAPGDLARTQQARRRAELVLPLVLKDEVAGVLLVEDREGRVFTDEEARLAEAFADQAALALENAELYVQAERRRREAEVLAELAQTINASPDLETILKRVAERARELCDADLARVALQEPGSDAMVFRYWAGGRVPDWQTLRIEPGKGLGGKVLLSGQAFRTGHYARDERISKDYLAIAQAEGIVADMAAPIRLRGRVEGLLFADRRSGRAFTEHEEAVLTRLAEHAAVAIQNARLIHKLRNRQARLGVLLDLAREVSRIQPVASLLQRIAHACGQLLGSDSVGVRLLEGDELVLTATSGEADGSMLVPRLRRGEGLAGVVASTGRPLLTGDLADDARTLPAHREVARRLGYRAWLGVPVALGERVLGVLSARTRHPAGFSAEDVEIATAFAAQAAIALENSRLYGELDSAVKAIEASQQRLVQAERLRALGEMAAGVAHDFNNLLAVILGRAELMLPAASEPLLLRGIEAIRQAALDGAQTVRRIQEFTRTRRTRPFGRVDVTALLGDVVDLIRPRWEGEAQSRGLRYEVEVAGPSLPPVAGLPEELREVFTNLLVNALEAMPTGGRLTLRTAQATGWVVVSVEDTGHGMPEEVRRRVFEPFFTTKGVRGNGLGLAVAWGIVTRHGGTIEVESEVGRGTRVVVRLPVGEIGEGPDDEATLPLGQPRRSARLLLIEDEPPVRDVVREMLEAGGYAVVAAAGGAEGLALCQTEPVDLVLTDVSMPEMSGWDVAAKLSERFPGLAVGFLTGWGDRLDPDELARYGVRFVLAKPVEARHLVRQVVEALESFPPRLPSDGALAAPSP